MLAIFQKINILTNPYVLL